MNETTRLAAAVGLGLAFVVWQASQEPGRLFAAVLAVVAVGYAFAPVLRDGIAD
ncbi:hypothetical protein M0R88_08600 [Halorussus gelatinilyticus]|uniref:Uncharacterized protein n=1 Tax=Halorussus gelatinilyticus TaxID=2937524 RepID=A0A8U0IN11_9EURY|nr:hypothetical protein [Halorussus gelatinilyticus]UPW02138.1 hypothetical protein M0R88_08600 [Halorussus gelatinilyticus]